MKKNYERPAIVHTEKLEARATTCAKADDAACGAGPMTNRQHLVAACRQRTADINERTLGTAEVFGQHDLGDTHD